MKKIISIKTIVAQLEVFKKYDANNHKITLTTEIILEIKKEYFKFGEIIFDIFEGIIKKAPIKSIQNIFILIDINIDKKIKKNKL